MKITEKLAALTKADEPYFSLEFFPPKTDMVCNLPWITLIAGARKPSIPFKPDG
jgi:hypothetical protein